MDAPPDPDPRRDRIVQAEERLRAAVMRMSQAQELLVQAKHRLALARLAVEHAQAQDTHDPPANDAAERSWRDEDDSRTARGAG
jgi:hypothetical protein